MRQKPVAVPSDQQQIEFICSQMSQDGVKAKTGTTEKVTKKVKGEMQTTAGKKSKERLPFMAYSGLVWFGLGLSDCQQCRVFGGCWQLDGKNWRMWGNRIECEIIVCSADWGIVNHRTSTMRAPMVQILGHSGNHAQKE